MKRFLRIGVYRGGQLVDDRYVPEKGEVSVGSSAKNMFALLGSLLPKEHVLFHFHKNHPVLHFVEGMTGEVALDGQNRQSLEALKARATRDGAGWTIEVPDTARGWVAMADATFFFQVTEKPPPPPRRELPKEARTGLLGSLEMAFVGILAGVLAVEGVAIFAIHQRPDIAADAPASQETLDRFGLIAKPKVEEPKPKEDESNKKEDEDAKKRAEEEARKQAEEDKKAKKDDKTPEESARAEADRKAKVRDQVSKKGLLSVIGSTGGSGALANVFASGAGFSDDISNALAGAGGVQLATGDDSAARKGGSGAGSVGIGDLDSAVSGSGGKVGLAEKKRVEPKITFDDNAFEAESSTVDKASLGKYIRMRIKSVQACYEKELKRNPSLKGKIVVRFLIMTTGKVSEVSIDQNTMGDDEVASCIVNTIRRWSFPLKPEEDSPVSFPFVFSPGG